jgi:hypothetical protein
MKTTLLLCLVVALTGCSTPNPSATPAPGSGPFKAMDSPIIISDGSTHLRHKGANADFQITDSGAFVEAIVNDAGFQVGKGESVKGVLAAVCPADFQKPLVQGWKMQVFDNSNTLVMTLTTSNSPSPEVDTTFSVSNVFTSADGSGDTATNAGPGSDVGTAPNVNNFTSAIFTNGGGGSPETITCNSSPCKLKIRYNHP